MKTARKIAAWLLCFSMLISNVTVYGEDILSAPESSDLIIQDEVFPEIEGETQLQGDLQEEELQDGDNMQDEIEESRSPVDLSENKDIIYQVIYMEQADSLLKQKIGLELSFQNTLIEQGIKVKDTLFFFVPEECATVNDTGVAVPVYDKNSNSQIGEYT
ncbi:MAG: hypothetical protein Q4B37_05185, partial [Eubacteriales bacterium]|nr:hypothetical protein [Eubacteriales bacterium]